MASLRITVKDAEGGAVSGALVKVKAIGSGNEPVYESGSGALVKEAVDHTDATGLVTFTLTANASLIPSESYYRVTIQAPSERKARVVDVQIPLGAGPFDLEDVLHDPGTIETSALAAHKLSLGDHGDVDLTGNATGKVLMWDGTNYVPADTHATDLEVSSAILVETNARTAADSALQADVDSKETPAGAQAKVELARPVAFLPHDDNPVFTPADAGGSTSSGYADVVYDPVGELFHLYFHRSDLTVGHSTSPTGQGDWTYVGVALPKGGAGEWDETGVGVPCVWIEDGTWYMLYWGRRAPIGVQDGTGLATSPDGTTWTKEATNPVIEHNAAGWNPYGAELGPGNVIKVGSTYYAYPESGRSMVSDAERRIGVMTSTDLVTWTDDAANPIFSGGRFCPSVFKDGSFFYMLVPHYTTGKDYSEIEIYRSPSPTFYPEERDYLGVVKRTSASGWDSADLDTAFILSDTIQRDTRDATDGELWMYYAGEDSVVQTGLLIGERLREFVAQPTVAAVIGPWARDNILGTETIDLVLPGTPSRIGVPMTRSGSITGIGVRSSEARTAGTATVTPTLNGTPVDLSAALNSTFPTGAGAAAVPGSVPYMAGDEIGVELVTSGWTPTTADITVSVEVTPR